MVLFLPTEHDRGINYENGGITNEGVINFNENIELPTGNKYQLTSKMQINRSRVRGIVLQQYFNILKPTITKKVDTIYNPGTPEI